MAPKASRAARRGKSVLLKFHGFISPAYCYIITQSFKLVSPCRATFIECGVIFPSFRKETAVRNGFFRSAVLFLISAATVFPASQAGKTVSDSAKTVELDRMVVTGSKSARPVEDVAASVSVVRQEEIERMGVANVDEALRYESGVYSKRSKGLMESMAGIVMRGFSGTDQVLVLLDGQPMNNGYVGRPQFNNIPLEDVSRIEIARGPFSSLYGSNAMGGVVNILTRTPLSKRLTVHGSVGGGPDAGLCRNIYAGYEEAPLPGKLGLAFSISDRRDEGYVTNDLTKSAKPSNTGIPVTGVKALTDRYGKEVFQYGEGGKNGAQNRSIGGRLFWSPNGEHSLRSGLNISWYDYWSAQGKSFLLDSTGARRDTGTVNFRYNDTTYSMRVDERNFLDGNGGQGNLYYSLSYRGELSGRFVLTASGGLNSQFENWYTSIGSTSLTTRGKGPGKINSTPNTKGNLDVQVEMNDIVPRNSVLAGIGAQGAVAKTREYNLFDWQRPDETDTLMYESGGKTAVAAFYLNDEFTVLEEKGAIHNLILSAGLRIDYWRTMAGMNHDYVSGKVINEYDAKSKVACSPRFGATLNLGEGAIRPSFRISGGRAFRPPTVYDLYRTWLSAAGNLTESNPDLRPETMWSIEGGSAWRFFEEVLTLDANAFLNNVEDMIYTTTIEGAYTDDGGEISRKMNLGKARIQGFEGSVSVKPIKEVTIFGVYGYTDSYVLEMEEFPEYVYKDLTLVPRHTTGFGLRADIGPLHGSLSSRYVSKRYTADNNSDTVDGVYGSRDPYFVTDCSLTLRLGSRCALTLSVDNLFDESYYDYYRAPGRTVSGGVKVEFR